ncbi:folliculin [Phlebotomus argentipes]|uniref:folliculin n=1 Tax=Phlebotomus argentipes TaxID=94469 RepID=UPI0028933F64|nr:folliculin [Phlebotomus argentipes]
MNAVIALCHFCELHGPLAIFCTQTLRETRLSDVLCTKKGDLLSKKCSACTSLDDSMVFMTKDEAGQAKFVSSQQPVIGDVIPLVKQAAFRSLSCEINNKDDGLVFFGDGSRGHVLSHTFQIPDSKARGFYRLFSILVLMKDKLFLLNIQPFLSHNLKKISAQLKEYANATNPGEQSRQSEKAQRLSEGMGFSQPRPLTELTGEKHIFAHMHSHFAWILWAGAQYLKESVTIGSPMVPPWLGKDTEEGFAMVQIDKEEWLMRKHGMDEIDDDGAIIRDFRRFRILLGHHFFNVCYCVLVGIQVILRGPPGETLRMIKCFKKLLPKYLHRLIHIDSSKYLSPSECRILTVSSNVTVPQPCTGIFRVDFSRDREWRLSVEWLGEVPGKTPDLLTKIMRAFEEEQFTDVVLEKHLRVLIEEWNNKINCLKKIQNSQDVSRIKKILNVQPQDALLVNYWSNNA